MATLLPDRVRHPIALVNTGLRLFVHYQRYNIFQSPLYVVQARLCADVFWLSEEVVSERQ